MIVIVMGVAGSGKSEVGRMLAARLNGHFIEGDEFHPGKNLRKMAAGAPLSEVDRAPFYAALRSALLNLVTAQESVVLACSALRASHRARLTVSSQTRFVYLKVAPDLLRRRLEARTDHFFPHGLLSSQLQTLEEPVEVSAVTIVVTAEDSVTDVVDKIEAAL